MKTVNSLITVLCFTLIVSCDDEIITNSIGEVQNVVELAPEMQMPTSIIIDDFDEDSILVNKTTFTYNNGTLSSKSWTSNSWKITGPDSTYVTLVTDYTFQNSLLEKTSRYFDPMSTFNNRYTYNAESKLLKKEGFGTSDSITHLVEHQHISNYHINSIDVDDNSEIKLIEGSSFQLDQITKNESTSNYFYTDGLLSTIEHRNTDNELIKLEEFEYLDKKVSGAYNKLKYKYGTTWKINALLDEGYSHNLEEAYITKHTISNSDEAEWTFYYTFDSLDRVSKQFLNFHSEESKFSCITYYNY